MAKTYSITRSLSFDADTGYWHLTLTVDSTTDLNPNPFLLEKAIEGTTGEDTLSTSPQEPIFIRTLLENENATKRLITDAKTYDKFTWVQYRHNSITPKFYSYDSSINALESTLSILKSNCNLYLTDTVVPRLLVINMTSEQREPQLTSIDVTKGDVVSLQLVNGPSTCSLISDGSYILLSPSSDVSNPKTNNFTVKITSDTTSIGLRVDDTLEEFSIAVNMLDTPRESSVSEIIR